MRLYFSIALLCFYFLGFSQDELIKANQPDKRKGDMPQETPKASIDQYMGSSEIQSMVTISDLYEGNSSNQPFYFGRGGKYDPFYANLKGSGFIEDDVNAMEAAATGRSRGMSPIAFQKYAASEGTNSGIAMQFDGDLSSAFAQRGGPPVRLMQPRPTQIDQLIDQIRKSSAYDFLRKGLTPPTTLGQGVQAGARAGDNIKKTIAGYSDAETRLAREIIIKGIDTAYPPTNNTITDIVKSKSYQDFISGK